MGTTDDPALDCDDPHGRAPEPRERLITLLSALSHPTRLEMLELILRRGEIGCREFETIFPLAKSTISYHAKILNAARLITTRREGRFFYYSPVTDVVREELPRLFERLGGSQAAEIVSGPR